MRHSSGLCITILSTNRKNKNKIKKQELILTYYLKLNKLKTKTESNIKACRNEKDAEFSLVTL